MLFLAAAATLQILVALAAPPPSEPLSIPVSHILKRDLSGHEEHPYFGVYKRWLESPVGSHMRRNAHAFLEEHPNLVSVECRQGDSNCLLVSRASLPTLVARELAEPSIQRRWAGSPNSLLISTHLKTYEGNDEDVDPPMGHEHYLDANIKCGTLDYRSTGFTLDTFEIGKHVSWYLTLTTKKTEDPNVRVRIGQGYTCWLFSDKCCLQTCWTELWAGEREKLFDRDSTCECNSSHDVSEQKCDHYRGDGWCGVHITQYQKNEGPGMSPEHYRFTVNIKDAEGKPIGEHDLVPIPSGETGDFSSLLPAKFLIDAPDVDEDAIWMHYKNQHFTSNDQEHHCDFGAYDSGKREGDCGFSC